MRSLSNPSNHLVVFFVFCFVKNVLVVIVPQELALFLQFLLISNAQL